VAPPTALPQKRVLVVDDSKFVRTTFASILSASFAVREEADGEAAWLAIETDPSIVMVFTDLEMPRLDGFDLLSRIRGSRDAHIRALPVVVISGHEEQENKQRARELGANDFIAKSADASEVLARLDNVLRLVRTGRDLEASRQALERTATHDPLTGTFTPHYLVTEGRKYFARARRHGGELSVMAVRLDSLDEIVRTAGKDVADVVITRVAKLVMERIRAEDSVARTAPATFMVLAAGTAAAQMVALSQRLRGELDEAKVTFREQVLRFSTSFGIAALGVDPANSIEELMRLALQRLQTVPNAPAAPKPAGLPSEIERALRVLEKADLGRLGAAAGEVLDRLKRIAKSIQAKRR
jgi:two-component system cell cycle response regulator